MNTAKLDVPDISCGHCKSTIEEAVGDLDGVAAVEVAVEDRTVKLTFDETTIDLDRIKSAIESVGYEVAGS